MPRRPPAQDILDTFARARPVTVADARRAPRRDRTSSWGAPNRTAVAPAIRLPFHRPQQVYLLVGGAMVLALSVVVTLIVLFVR